jgi:hypothetical protein
MEEVRAKPERRWRDLAPRLLVLGGAVALGLALQHALGGRLAAIQALAAQDVIAARRELALVLRVVGGLVFGTTTAVGVAMIASSRRALSAGVFPAPGVWSWGARRRVVGPRARTLARLSIGLAACLIACSLAALALVLGMAAQLLACRAGAA